MKNQRLQKRGKFYYLRVAIPRNLSNIIGRKEIKYSLKTTCYQEALAKLRVKTAEIDWTIKTIRDQESVSLYERLSNMKVITLSGIKFLELDEKEFDKITIDRIKDLYNFIETIKQFQKSIYIKKLKEIKKNKNTNPKKYDPALEKELETRKDKDIQKINDIFGKIFLHCDWNLYYNYIKEYFNKKKNFHKIDNYNSIYFNNYVFNNLKNIIDEFVADKIYLYGIKPLIPDELSDFEGLFDEYNNEFYPIKELENIKSFKGKSGIQYKLIRNLLDIDNEILNLYNNFFMTNTDVEKYTVKSTLKNYYEVLIAIKNSSHQNTIKNIVENLKTDFSLENKYNKW